MTQRYYLVDSLSSFLSGDGDPIFTLRYGDVDPAKNSYCFPLGTEKVYSKKSLMRMLAYYFYNDGFTIKGCNTIRCESEIWRCALNLLEKIKRDESWVYPAYQNWTDEDHIGAIVVDHGESAHSTAPELKAQIEHQLEWRNDGHLLLHYRMNPKRRHDYLRRFKRLYYSSVTRDLQRVFEPDSPMMYEIEAKTRWTETHGLPEHDHRYDHGIWVFKPRESEIQELITSADHQYPTRQNMRRFD